MAKFMNSMDNRPVLHLEFANGWTVSILKRWDGKVCNVALAAWPTSDTDPRQASSTEIGKSEASDDEVADFIASVVSRRKYRPVKQSSERSPRRTKAAT